MGFRFTLRNNFYNWNVSVEGTYILDMDLESLCERGYLYFEGFPPDRKFGEYERGTSKRFSISFSDNYQLYTFFWLLIQNIKAVEERK